MESSFPLYQLFSVPCLRPRSMCCGIGSWEWEQVSTRKLANCDCYDELSLDALELLNTANVELYLLLCCITIQILWWRNYNLAVSVGLKMCNGMEVSRSTRWTNYRICCMGSMEQLHLDKVPSRRPLIYWNLWMHIAPNGSPQLCNSFRQSTGSCYLFCTPRLTLLSSLIPIKECCNIWTRYR